jgi:hypothetical protein
VQTLNRITPRALMYGGRPGDPEYMIVCCYHPLCQFIVLQHIFSDHCQVPASYSPYTPG